MLVSQIEDLVVPEQEGGSAFSDNAVTKPVLSILYALSQQYVPL
jgi:hypothetical protein